MMQYRHSSIYSINCNYCRSLSKFINIQIYLNIKDDPTPSERGEPQDGESESRGAQEDREVYEEA